MIGSHAKRRAIEQAMTSHRIDPAQIARMQCPLGMDGIQDQSPEVIAVSACAALLRAREDMRL
jgi:xanthine dehydrogenase accessory factor